MAFPDSLPLAQTFLAARPRELGLSAEALETRLASIVASSRQLWPGVHVPESAFVAHLAQRLPDGGEFSEGVGALHSGDLYLACGCLLAIPSAISAFERRMGPELRLTLKRIDPSSAFADEICQRLSEKLFVKDCTDRPHIASYRGHGPLLNWVRAIAVRDALKQRRTEMRTDGFEPCALATQTPIGNLELEIIRSRHRTDFSAAFEAAFAILSSRERNVLRMHILHGLSITQIGAFYRTHRATAFRWLEAARAELTRGIWRELSKRLHLSRAELESLMGLVRSQLDVSIRRILETSTT